LTRPVATAACGSYRRRVTTPPDSSAQDIALVESFFAAFRRLDIDGAMALMSDDIVYQNVPFPADRGKVAVARTLRVFGRFFTGFDVQIHHIAARDGVVLTERLDTLTGPLLFLDLPVCGTLEVRDGRITVWRDYFDLAGATAKLFVGPIRALFARR
jgi:limonene-1,2-epoxide hydrolase